MKIFKRHRKLFVLTFLLLSILGATESNNITETNATDSTKVNCLNSGPNNGPCDNMDSSQGTQDPVTSLENDYDSTQNVSTSQSELEPTTHLWKILDSLQVVILFIGLFANIFTIFVMSRVRGNLSPVAGVLMIHQALMDALVCAFMIPTFLVPAFWTSGHFHADTFLCHVWHSQFPYWWALLMSVWTLVLMSIDRFIAIKYPLKYNLVRPKHFIRALVGIYIVTFFIALPAVFEFSYNPETKECTSDFYSDSPIFSQFISAYGIIWFAGAYGVPVPLLFLFYGIILHTLRKRMKDTKLGESAVIIRANTQATKTFGYVTAFFIFSFSFDSWYYLLYAVGVVSYVYHSPIQVVSVFMTALNSCVNPFIYAASMPFIRRAIVNMFRCKKGEKSQSEISNTSTVSAVANSQSTTLSNVTVE